MEYDRKKRKENLVANKYCKHKFKRIKPDLEFCIKCGFERWRQ